jgi:CcmD family protein
LAILLLAAALVSTPVAIAAQAPAASAQDAAPAAESTSTPDANTAAGGEVDGGDYLPRNMRPYWHFFLAFGAAWVLLGGYVISLGRRFGRLEEELESLRKR